MDLITGFLTRFLSQLQSPTLSFLIGGALLAAMGSKLTVPNPVYQFIVFLLLMKVGLKGGVEIREANLGEMVLPALFSVAIGVGIVIAGHAFFSLVRSVRREDGTATAGLFGAVSASTLAAGMVLLEEQNMAYEAWVPALYPFMDIPALVVAIVLANLHRHHAEGGSAGAEGPRISPWSIVRESLQGAALSALILGTALGLVARPEQVLESFYEPLFRGLLSVLMLVLGMEAWSRLKELRQVAHWFAIYALVAPIIHGLFAFALGYVAYVWTGFSPGGVVLLAIIAASNSDISGPPTIRAGIPWANPSSYIGASTSVGTPVAIGVCVPMFVALGEFVF